MLTETGCAGLWFEHVSVSVSHRCSPAQTGTTREAPEDHRLALCTEHHRHTSYQHVFIYFLEKLGKKNVYNLSTSN